MELFDMSGYAAPVGGMKTSFKTKKQTAEAIASAVRILEWPDHYKIANTEKTRKYGEANVRIDMTPKMRANTADVLIAR